MSRRMIRMLLLTCALGVLLRVPDRAGAAGPIGIDGDFTLRVRNTNPAGPRSGWEASAVSALTDQIPVLRIHNGTFAEQTDEDFTDLGIPGGEKFTGHGVMRASGKYEAANGQLTGSWNYALNGTYVDVQKRTVGITERFTGQVKTLVILKDDTRAMQLAAVGPLAISREINGKSFDYGSNEVALTPEVRVGPPAPNDSGTAAPSATPAPEAYAAFSGLGGQVEVRDPGCEGEDCWRMAKYDTVLKPGMHIRTQDQSSAVVGFADLSTYVLKPESEIVVAPPEAKVSSLQLLKGNIWHNLKKMIQDGSMEVEMNQAIAGARGTTYVLSDRNGESTVQVIEGTVAFRAKSDGKVIDVTKGQTVTATKSGLGEVKSFDANAVSADWDALRLSTQQRPQAPRVPFYQSPTVLLGDAAAIALLALLASLAMRRRTPA